MSETTVTQALYQAVMGMNPSHVALPNHPVTQVSWLDAVHFCNRLSTYITFNQRTKARSSIEWNRNAGGFVCRLKQSGNGLPLLRNTIYAGSAHSDL